jgi:hypothetical protein
MTRVAGLESNLRAPKSLAKNLTTKILPAKYSLDGFSPYLYDNVDQPPQSQAKTRRAREVKYRSIGPIRPIFNGGVCMSRRQLPRPADVSELPGQTMTVSERQQAACQTRGRLFYIYKFTKWITSGYF